MSPGEETLLGDHASIGEAAFELRAGSQSEVQPANKPSRATPARHMRITYPHPPDDRPQHTTTIRAVHPLIVRGLLIGLNACYRAIFRVPPDRTPSHATPCYR